AAASSPPRLAAPAAHDHATTDRSASPPAAARCLGLAALALGLALGLGAPRAGAVDMVLPGSFDVSPVGVATYTIPIEVPPGTAGMTPSLTLQYSSGAPNGLLGMGWSLGGLPSITRCPRTVAQDGARGGVNYDMNDR